MLGLCIILNALDGFDVLAMAFTANSVTREFGLSGAELASCSVPGWSAWPSDPWVWRPSQT